MHEQMIGVEDARTTHEFGDSTKFFPHCRILQKFQGRPGQQVPEGFTYTSDKNADWMTREFLAQWIEENKSSLEAVY